MAKWAFGLGELVLCASSTRVVPELRGQIVEIADTPRRIEAMGDQFVYTIEHEAGRFYASESVLSKLTPPGTRPCDLTYDGNLTAGSWDGCPWRPRA